MAEQDNKLNGCPSCKKFNIDVRFVQEKWYLLCQHCGNMGSGSDMEDAVEDFMQVRVNQPTGTDQG